MRAESIFCLLIYPLFYFTYTEAGTFSVDYANHVFLKDGQPFRYMSGSIHYMRVHPGLWNDRLQRIRALGFNAVQVYVPWNLHEPTEGNFDFTTLNLTHFLTLAQQNDLNVLLRPGPYICAEWENGGFPWWLLKYDGIELRTYNTIYLQKIQNYYNTLLAVVQPLLYKNGGPILTIQVENEYGYAGACSHNYTEWLRDLIWSKLGDDVVLTTVDGAYAARDLECGTVPKVYATVDFGISDDGSIDNYFSQQNKYNNGGPNVCTEYWVNWFTIWGQTSGNTPDPNKVVDNMKHMYVHWNASFNVYMLHGGTNFGATNYGQVTLQRIGANLISTLTQIQEPCQQGDDPLDFEKLDHGYGFVLYTTTLANAGKILSTPVIRDYGYVFVNNVYQNQDNFILGHNGNSKITISAQAGDVLRILVENRGRQNDGSANDAHKKGLKTNVTLDGVPLKNWYACGINLTSASVDSLTSKFFTENNQTPLPEKATSTPGVYTGQFSASALTDTFFNPTGWSKGQLFVNGFNVGRYWNVGPQVTLYVPKPVIQPMNTVVVIELLGSQQNYVNFIDHAVWTN